jgi:hypothetical protein
MNSTGTAEITGHADANLNGTVTFHVPTLIENVRIEQRATALARPHAFESLPPDGRALIRLIATLEHVIDTAPKGFYVERDGRPHLSLEHLSSADEGLLWQVFAAWRAVATTFRHERTGGAEASSGEAGSAGDVGSREGPQP